MRWTESSKSNGIGKADGVKSGPDIAKLTGVVAMSDVTGFGLLGIGVRL